MKNVILLTIDTLRKDVLGCYGGGNLTPFIDSLQDRSIKYTKAQTIAPYTQASFPGILTSSYYFDCQETKKLSPERTLLSEPLRRAGIRTAAFHSNTYLCGFFGWNRGWDTFYDSMQDQVTDIAPYAKGDVINQKVDAWLSAEAGDDSSQFFLWAHYMDVHEPYVPEKKYLQRIDPSINLTSDEMFALFKEVLLERDVSDKSRIELLKKLYQAHILEVDEHSRSFFEILKKHNVLDNSIVIITSDHGDEFGEHGSLSHNGKMYSELIDCPLLIYDGSLMQGQICDRLVSGIDISPTVLDLFGLEKHPDFQGQPLLPLENYVERGCFGEAIGKLGHKIKDTDKPTYFYRREDLKIIYRREEDQWQLYDLKEDPQEQINIIETSASAGQMKNVLRTRINRQPK